MTALILPTAIQQGKVVAANAARSLSRLRERVGERACSLGRAVHALSLSLPRKRGREPCGARLRKESRTVADTH
jgi:hypothetical protein